MYGKRSALPPVVIKQCEQKIKCENPFKNNTWRHKKYSYVKTNSSGCCNLKLWTWGLHNIKEKFSALPKFEQN